MRAFPLNLPIRKTVLATGCDRYQWISKKEASPYDLTVTKLIEDITEPAAESIHPEAAVAPGYLANHASRVFNRLVDARLRDHGLTLSLIGPLLLLSWKGPMLQRDLVRHSAVKQPAMVALLDKLEAGGMICRAASTTDKRAAVVDLTDRGRDAAALGRAVLLEMNAKAVNGFASDEASTVVSLLTRVIANLEGEAGT